MRILRLVCSALKVAQGHDLVVYTVPAVIIGGRIGPRLQGKVSELVMERAIGVLFAIIGLAMFWMMWEGLSDGG